MPLLNVLTHVSLASVPALFYYWIYVVEAPASDESSALFKRHPASMALGIGFLMAESALAFRKDGLLRAGSWGLRQQLHWCLNFLGVLCMSFGVRAIYAAKSLWGGSHWDNPHAIGGLAVLLLAWNQLVAGTIFFSLRPRWVSGKMLAIVRKVHKYSGMLILVLGFLNLLGGTLHHLQFLLEVVGAAETDRVFTVGQYCATATAVALVLLLVTLVRGRSVAAADRDGPKVPY